MNRDYPDDWESRRQKVYRRDEFECQNCGKQGGPSGDTELHAHHIVPNSKGGTHQVSNLVTLCHECHEAIHTSKSAPSIQNIKQDIDESELKKYPYKSNKGWRAAVDEGNIVDISHPLKQEALNEVAKQKTTSTTLGSDCPECDSDNSLVEFIGNSLNSKTDKIHVKNSDPTALNTVRSAHIVCCDNCGAVWVKRVDSGLITSSRWERRTGRKETKSPKQWKKE